MPSQLFFRWDKTMDRLMTISTKLYGLLHLFPAKSLLKPLVAMACPWNEVVLGRSTPHQTMANLASSGHASFTFAESD